MSKQAICMYHEIPVLDSVMAYQEMGDPTNPAVLFIHGNPTSSYIWRNIMPHVSRNAHCIAVDLIGFGRSGKPDIDYRFVDHVRYVDAFLEVLGLQQFYLIAQDWGTAIAFHYAARKPEAILGLGFMEFIRPMTDWEDFHPSPESRAVFQKFRTPGEGEKLILDNNLFVERILPGSIMRKLSDEEMDAYRAPFMSSESRKPTLQFPRELPIAGKPEDVHQLIEQAHQALLAAQYPKILFSADPGVLTPPRIAEDYANRLRSCKHIRLGKGAHYLQEDHADRIGQEIAVWIEECQKNNLCSIGG